MPPIVAILALVASNMSSSDEPPRHDWRVHFRERVCRTLSWPALLDEFYVDLERRKVRSRRDMRGVLERHARREFAAFDDVRKITPAVLDAWIDAQLAGGTLARSSVSKHADIMSVALDYALETGALDMNPARQISRRLSKEPIDPERAGAEVLTRPHWTRVCLSPRILFEAQNLYALSLLTGSRFGEGAGFNWQDREHAVPFRALILRRQYSTKERLLLPPKTRIHRRLPIGPLLEQHLERAWAWWIATFGRKPEPDEPIAPYPKHRQGKDPEPVRWNERTALRRWHKDLAALDIPTPAAGPRRLHATRHTFITELIVQEKVPERAVLGMTHSKQGERSAFARYVHYDWPARCDAVAKLQYDPAEQAECQRERAAGIEAAPLWSHRSKREG